MSGENYYNYYIDVMKDTLSDIIMKNISLQASIKVSESTINDLNKTLKLMDAEIGELQQKLNSTNEYSDYLYLKEQAQHVETFRNELLKSRQETESVRDEYEKRIKFLENKLNSKTTSPKRKKQDKISPINTQKDITEDGGTF